MRSPVDSFPLHVRGRGPPPPCAVCGRVGGTTNTCTHMFTHATLAQTYTLAHTFTHTSIKNTDTQSHCHTQRGAHTHTPLRSSCCTAETTPIPRAPPAPPGGLRVQTTLPAWGGAAPGPALLDKPPEMLQAGLTRPDLWLPRPRSSLTINAASSWSPGCQPAASE